MAKWAIVLILLFALSGIGLAQDDAGKASIESVILHAFVTRPNMREGEDRKSALTIYIQTSDNTLEQPLKYRVSWTSKKWLSWKKPNPENRRRGNLFLDAGSNGMTSRWGIQVALPPGRTLRVRVRPIYADRTRGEVCIKDGVFIHTRVGGTISFPDWCR